LNVAAKALEKAEPTPGRMRLIDGLKETVIIDDSYNSSPVALEEALSTLKSIKPKARGRKIAVLGDMLELVATLLTNTRRPEGLAAEPRISRDRWRPRALNGRSST